MAALKKKRGLFLTLAALLVAALGVFSQLADGAAKTALHFVSAAVLLAIAVLLIRYYRPDEE